MKSRGVLFFLSAIVALAFAGLGYYLGSQQTASKANVNNTNNTEASEEASFEDNGFSYTLPSGWKVVEPNDLYVEAILLSPDFLDAKLTNTRKLPQTGVSISIRRLDGEDGTLQQIMDVNKKEPSITSVTQITIDSLPTLFSSGKTVGEDIPPSYQGREDYYQLIKGGTLWQINMTTAGSPEVATAEQMKHKAAIAQFLQSFHLE